MVGRSEDYSYIAATSPLGHNVTPTAAYQRTILARPRDRIGESAIGHAWAVAPHLVPPPPIAIANYLIDDRGPVRMLNLNAIMPSDIEQSTLYSNRFLKLFLANLASRNSVFHWRRDNYAAHPRHNTSVGSWYVNGRAIVNQAGILAASMLDLGDIRAATLIAARCPESVVKALTERLDCSETFQGDEALNVFGAAARRIASRSINHRTKANTVDLYEAAGLVMAAFFQHNPAFKNAGTDPTILNTSANQFDVESVTRSPNPAVQVVRRIIDPLRDQVLEQWRDKDAMRGVARPAVAPGVQQAETELERRRRIEVEIVVCSIVLAGAVHAGRELKKKHEQKIDHIGAGLTILFAGLGTVPHAGPALGVVGNVISAVVALFKDCTDVEEGFYKFLGAVRQDRMDKARSQESATKELVTLKDTRRRLLRAVAPALDAPANIAAVPADLQGQLDDANRRIDELTGAVNQLMAWHNEVDLFEGHLKVAFNALGMAAP